MPQNITLYKLLISCPGDVKDEIEIIKEAVDKFNELYSDALGITIQTKHWSKSSYPQSGDKPQALLNNQFINDCDAAVAIFWTRFGSPTDDYGSGTEEEIEIMLENKKQVFMYFSDKSPNLSQINTTEIERVRAFKEKYKDRGLYDTYSTNEDFRLKFFAHLSQYFLSEAKISELAAMRAPLLKICSIDDNNSVRDSLCVQRFKFNTDTTVADYELIIKNKIEDINQIKIDPIYSDKSNKTDNINQFSFDIVSAMYEKEEFSTGIIDTIKATAKCMEITLSDDFFYIGNLRRSKLPLNSGLDGTENELKKYKNIMSLYHTINDVLDWAPIERAFDGIMCVKLALMNDGTAIDEDVEVKLSFPKATLKTLEEFPKLNYDDMEYLSSKCKMEVLFGIEETSEFQKYSFSDNKTPYMPVEPYIPVDPLLSHYSGTNYKKLYEKSLKSVFFYKCFVDNDRCILKIKFDYIKHNTVIAFPTPILLNEDITKIDYTITSKNNPQIINGVLEIG